MIIWYWDALEADFLRFYKLDINECLYTMTWRKASVLIRNLPADSAFAAKLRDKKSRAFAEWDERSVTQEFLKAK